MTNITKLICVGTIVVLCSLCCLVQAQSPYIGEIYVYPYPHLDFHDNEGGFYCEGQLLPISQYEVLFYVIGTTYGGDGVVTFALPNLMGRTPIGQGVSDLGTSYTIGQSGGSNGVNLANNQVPGFTSALVSNIISPHNKTCEGGTPTLAQTDNVCESELGTDSVTLFSTASQTPRENLMKSMALYFVIYSEGIYPPRDRNAEPEINQEEREVEINEEKEEKGREELEGEEHKVASRGDDDGMAFIQLFAIPFAPSGYATCSNQLLSINQNNALFALLGTYYGGNGINTFNLPDLRGRGPYSSDSGNIGNKYGAELRTVTQANVPSYTSDVHFSAVSSNSARYCATSTKAFVAKNICSPPSSTSSIQLNTATSAQPHANLQPYLVISYTISIQGIFPSRNKRAENRGYGQPYVGQMMIFAGTFEPYGFFFCKGQILSISQFTPLYQKIGTKFGGDGVNTFALPDMRNTIPVGVGTNPESGQVWNLGDTYGSNTISLQASNMPSSARSGTLPVFTRKSPNTNCANSKNAFQQNSVCFAEPIFTAHGYASAPSNPQPIDITKPVQQMNWIIAFDGIF